MYKQFEKCHLPGYRMPQSVVAIEARCTDCADRYVAFTFDCPLVGLLGEDGSQGYWNSASEPWHHSKRCTDCQQGKVLEVIRRTGLRGPAKDSAMRGLFNAVYNGSCDTQGETDGFIWRQFFSHLDLAVALATALANGDDPEPQVVVSVMTIIWNSGRPFDNDAVAILQLMIEENIAEMKCNVDLTCDPLLISNPQPPDWATEVERRVKEIHQQEETERENEQRRCASREIDQGRGVVAEVSHHMQRWKAAQKRFPTTCGGGRSMWAPRISC